MAAVACRRAAWAGCIKFSTGQGPGASVAPAPHQRSGDRSQEKTGRLRQPSSSLRHRHDDGNETQWVLVPVSVSANALGALAQGETDRESDEHGDRLAETAASGMNRHCFAALIASSSSPKFRSSDRTTLTSPTVPSGRTTASSQTSPWTLARIASAAYFARRISGLDLPYWPRRLDPIARLVDTAAAPATLTGAQPVALPWSDSTAVTRPGATAGATPRRIERPGHQPFEQSGSGLLRSRHRQRRQLHGLRLERLRLHFGRRLELCRHLDRHAQIVFAGHFDLARHLERLVAAAAAAAARPGLRNPDDRVVGPVDLDELLGRRGPDHQKDKDEPDHMAGERGAKRPANACALHPEGWTVVGPAGGTDRATSGQGAAARPPPGRAALPPAPFRGRVGLISPWKRNLAEAQAAHAMRSLPTPSWSTTVTHSRMQSWYRGIDTASNLPNEPKTIMVPVAYAVPTTAILATRPSCSPVTAGGTAARF